MSALFHCTACTHAGTFAVKAGLAQMLKGGIIMDVVSAEQARIAEEAGVCADMMCVVGVWVQHVTTTPARQR